MAGQSRTQSPQAPWSAVWSPATKPLTKEPEDSGYEIDGGVVWVDLVDWARTWIKEAKWRPPVTRWK